MQAHDLENAMKAPPDFVIESRDASFWMLQDFNEGSMWAGRFCGQSQWERHATTDELLHILDGEVDVTVMTDDEPVTTTVRAGSLFVVPRGRWHRLLARETVTSCGITPGSTEHSDADDPRNE